MKKLALILALALALSLVCVHAEEAAAPALLAYFTFDDAENLGADASGNGNDLVKAINPDGIQAVEGVKGGAAYFGGTSGLLAKDDANNDFMDTYEGKAFTVSFWAKVDIENARTGNSRAVDHGINGSDFGFTVLVNKNVAEDGTVTLFSISQVGGSDWWSSASNVSGDPAEWHQYTMVYDPEANLVVTFVDGERIKEVYADEDERIACDFTFCVGGDWAQWDWFNGGNHEVTAEGFIGAIDEVKIFAGAVYDFDIING